MSDGAVPTPIDHDESAALHIGRGDLGNALLSHIAADRIRDKALLDVIDHGKKYRWIGHGIKIAVLAAVTFLGVFGRDIAASVFDRATRPILEEQAAKFTKQTQAMTENFSISLREFKESVDKRIEKIEPQSRRRSHGETP